MKYLLLVSVAVAVNSASVLKDPIQGYTDDDRYFYFPGDGDGVLHYVDTYEEVDEAFIRQYTKNPENNGYWLYTRANPTSAQDIIFGNKRSVFNSNFEPHKITVVLTHGWNGHGNNNMNQLLTQAFLQDNDVNVIILDWSVLANKNYVTAKAGVAEVGAGLGRFISWLITLGGSYERIHLVGFSLGGHLVGSAGRSTDGLVKRITALDPAGPLWGSDKNRLSKTDGQYVEVIHTNAALLGYSDPCGDADFYPNGGSSMPGCWLNTCSHSRAFEYMASSVKYSHLLGNECGSLRDATRNICTGDLYPMGNSDLSKSRSGIFRVNTARNYPY